MVDVHWGDIVLTGFADPAAFGLPGFQAGDPVAVEAYATAITGLDIAYDAGAGRLAGTLGATDIRVAVRADRSDGLHWRAGQLGHPLERARRSSATAGTPS
jgi:hypothetical protein